jgi:hypothetical protein
MVELTEEIIEQAPGLLRVKLPDVGGEYELTCSPVLVQAVGKCAGVDFYFRAKHGRWEFETEDEFGHSFAENDPLRFKLTDRSDHKKPGAMGMNWSARLLRRCLAKWWGVQA